MYYSTVLKHTKDNPMLNKDFLPIPNYEMYYISPQGEIFNGRIIMKTFIQNCGYKMISLTKNSKRKHFLVHRLVAQVFITNPENKKYINHKDGNKQNNDISNLEWCTNRENILHAREIGLNPYNLPTLGIKKGKGSKYFNVSYDKSRNKWIGSIRENNKTIGQKRFNFEIDAALYVNNLIDLHQLNRPKNIF